MKHLYNKYLWYNSSFLNDIEKKFLNTEIDLLTLNLITQRKRILQSIGQTSSILSKNIQNSYSNIDINSFDEKTLIKSIKDNLYIKLEKISAAMIVSNEERCIKRCINSIIDKVDELVIINTGCSDNTITLINEYNNPKIKLFNHTWDNDFSKARNYAIKKSSYDWIFFIDADEYLDISYNDNLKILFNSFNSLSKHLSLTMCPKIKDSNDHISIGVQRIFKKSSGLLFYGKVHEQLRKDSSKIGQDVSYITLNIDINHDGYDENIMINKNKLQRNYDLLIQMMKLEPANPRWTYFLVRDSYELIGYETAEKLIKQSIFIDKNGDFKTSNIIYHEYIFSLLDILAGLKLNNCEFEELEKIIFLLEKINPDNSNCFYYKTMLKISKIKIEERELLLQTVNYRKNNSELQPGMLHSKGYHIDFLLGILLFELGDYKKAFKYFDFLDDKFIIEPLINQYKKIFEL